MIERSLTEQAKTRLRRIEGQVRGIQGMLDRISEDGPGSTETEPCDGLLTQILAVRAAVEQVGLLIMELHLQCCVLGDLAEDDDRMQGLHEALKLWSRLSSTR